MSAPAGDFGPEHIARCWKEALALWDVEVALSPPESCGWTNKEEPLAYIDLETRQVVVNFEMLGRMGAQASLTGVLAHEIGHHVRFPHTLGLAAALQVLEQRLIPGLKDSLTNMFFDLLVNEFVGRTHADQLCAVYRGFMAMGKSEPSPLFLFYLLVYEELWSLDQGSLVSSKQAAAMENEFPGCRSDARMFVQTFYALPGIHLQFVYFCCQFLRYLGDPAAKRGPIPMGHDVPDPDTDDFDAAVRGHGADQLDDALDEARARGWIDDAGAQDQKEDDPLVTIDRITKHMPGKGQGEFKQALVSKHYKRLVDQYILRIPGVLPRPQPFLPTVLEDWDWGDNPRAIDWTATVLAEGALAAVRPRRRELEPDEPSPHEQDLPAVEIYLDTSGSMPDPSTALNAMTLAAQILAASAIRKKGMVRGIIYSSGTPLLSPWIYDEETARRFFLHYVGGGTDYPFALLEKLSKERSDAIRVIISDSDFLSNVTKERAMDRLKFGIDHSRLLVAFLAADEKWIRKSLEPVLRMPRFRLAIVRGLDQFGQAAAALADAVIGS